MRLKGTFVGAAAVSSFERAMFEVLKQDRPNIIIDLSHTRFVDSAGLGAMIAAMVAVRRNEGALRLAGLRDEMRTIISTMNLERVFEIHETVAIAEESFQKHKN